MSDANMNPNPDGSTIRPSPPTGQHTYMVRRDKRESAFRKYEKYVRLALLGPYEIDPRAEPGLGVSPVTFRSRFLDAKKAFCDYSYKSDLIPNTPLVKLTLRNITANILDGGVRVRVYDKRREGGSANRAITLYTTSDEEKTRGAFEALASSGCDLVEVWLPEGSDEGRERVVKKLESQLDAWFGVDDSFGEVRHPFSLRMVAVDTGVRLNVIRRLVSAIQAAEDVETLVARPPEESFEIPTKPVVETLSEAKPQAKPQALSVADLEAERIREEEEDRVKRAAEVARLKAAEAAKRQV